MKTFFFFMSSLGSFLFFSCYEFSKEERVFFYSSAERENSVNYLICQEKNNEHFLIDLAIKIGEEDFVKVGEFMERAVGLIKRYNAYFDGITTEMDKSVALFMASKGQEHVVTTDGRIDWELLLFRELSTLNALKELKEALNFSKSNLEKVNSSEKFSISQEKESKIIKIRNDKSDQFIKFFSNALKELKKELITSLSKKEYRGLPLLSDEQIKRISDKINAVFIPETIDDLMELINSTSLSLAQARLVIKYNKEDFINELESILSTRAKIGVNEYNINEILSDYENFLTALNQEGPNSFDELSKRIASLEQKILAQKIACILTKKILASNEADDAMLNSRLRGFLR